MSADIKKINGVYMGSQEIASTRFAEDADALSYYRLESGALGTDEKGTNTLTNYNTVGSGTGKFGGASDQGSTNTTNKCLAKAGDPGYNGASDFPFSIVAWFNVPSTANDIRLANFNVNQRCFTRFGWYSTGAYLQFYRVNQSVQQGVVYPFTPTINTWYQQAITYDGTNVRGYLNGELVGTGAASGQRTTAETSGIGIGIDGQSFGTLGALDIGLKDDVYFSKRALTSDEIYSLYKTGVKKLNGVDNLTTPGIKKYNGVSNV